MDLTQTKQEKLEKLKLWLSKTSIDSVVTNKTIGVSSGTVTPTVLLVASAKCLRINKGEVEPDDRDNLVFSTFKGMEDFVKEHVEKDAGKLQLKARLKMRQKKDLSWLHGGFFTPQVRSVIIGHQLSQNIEGINPLENIDVSNKVSKMGEGGIQSSTGIPDESRAVSSSQFGFFDPFHMVESDTIGVVNYFTRHVRKGEDGKLYRLMLDRDKKPCWVDHEKILESKVELPEHS
jgi:DNA-directed RNA polymerase beta subunit